MTTKKLPAILLEVSVIIFICLVAISNVAPYKNDSTHPESIFETAVNIIKKYEGLHKSRHWPYIGYGHQVVRGEKYRRGVVLKQDEAEALLRKDLKKYIGQFSEYGADSVLLGVLAYNIGVGNVRRSSLPSLLGNEEKLRSTYLAHCRYRGKVMSQIQRRRTEEFDTLYPLIRAAEEESKTIKEMEAMVEKENKSLSWVLISNPEKSPSPGIKISPTIKRSSSP